MKMMNNVLKVLFKLWETFMVSIILVSSASVIYALITGKI